MQYDEHTECLSHPKITHMVTCYFVTFKTVEERRDGWICEINRSVRLMLTCWSDSKKPQALLFLSGLIGCYPGSLVGQWQPMQDSVPECSLWSKIFLTIFFGKTRGEAT